MKVKVNWDLESDGEVLTADEAGVPEVIDVPTYVTEDEVSDWLSDAYGWCHYGWKEV
jgi:hypothetical protein